MYIGQEQREWGKGKGTDPGTAELATEKTKILTEIYMLCESS